MQKTNRFPKYALMAMAVVCTFILSGCGKTAVDVSESAVQETESVPATEAALAIPVDSTVYVSLGDSIARGYGLTSPADERYSTIVGGLLERAGTPVTVFNYGVDGQTSAGLLETLTDSTVPNDVLSAAELCTISIGANNILGPGMTFLYEYYQYLYSDPAPYDDAGIAERYKIFTEACADGIEKLREDIPQIIDTLKKSSPDVDIYFLTLYNPYEHSPIVLNINGLPIRLSALSDTYCTLVNQCILDGSADGQNYHVVDVYTAFAGTNGAYVNVTNPEGLSETDMDMSAMDPHPNKAGHAKIAQLITEMVQAQ